MEYSILGVSVPLSSAWSTIITILKAIRHIAFTDFAARPTSDGVEVSLMSGEYGFHNGHKSLIAPTLELEQVVGTIHVAAT